jgi:hypothetical protein
MLLSPDLYLLGAVLRGGLRLVETLERAVVALVQAPVVLVGIHISCISSRIGQSVRISARAPT